MSFQEDASLSPCPFERGANATLCGEQLAGSYVTLLAHPVLAI